MTSLTAWLTACRLSCVFVVLLLVGFETTAFAQSTPQKKRPPTPDEIVAQFQETVEVRRDLPYAADGNRLQMVDVYLPKQRKTDRPLPVMAFIHGGGWAGGSRLFFTARACDYASSGEYAAVCIGYRLADKTSWPAQIHDCKAAIRLIRARAQEWNIDPDRIGLFGGSAGAHLALMLATTGGRKELEGDLGEFLDKSSQVACTVSICGPTDLTKPICSGRLAETLNGIVAKLLGGTIEEKPDAAREASPITHLSRMTPPILMLHGDKDSLVDFDQSVQFQAAAEKLGASALLIPLVGVDHNFSASAETLGRVRQFFDKHLCGAAVEISTEPIQRQDAIVQ